MSSLNGVRRPEHDVKLLIHHAWENTMSDGNGPKIISRFQSVLDSVNYSRNHIQDAKQQLYSLIADLDKADEFMGRFRASITKAIEDDGGVPDHSVENLLQDFLPKALRKNYLAPAANDNEPSK